MLSPDPILMEFEETALKRNLLENIFIFTIYLPKLYIGFKRSVELFIVLYESPVCHTMEGRD